MKNPSRWKVLWKAVKKWWKNEPPPAPVQLPPPVLIEGARDYLREYD